MTWLERTVKRLLTLGEAGTIVGVSGERINQFVKAGALRSIWRGKHLLDRREVERFAAKPRRGPGRKKKAMKA